MNAEAKESARAMIARWGMDATLLAIINNGYSVAGLKNWLTQVQEENYLFDEEEEEIEDCVE